jgi:2-polyprenyl-6-methoxyphenol hydroxylase-like FAD-dependent oxidoreductase
MSNKTSVVVGASMAGLMAAKVLADRFDQVLVIERDDLPDEVEARKGVPQGRHVHALLPSGEEVLNRFFPGFRDDLVADGALLVSPEGGISWWQQGGYRSSCEGPAFLFSSRPFLESQVRRRVQALPNVSFVSGTAEGVVTDGGRVRAARLRTGQESTDIDAGLVVDASGRSGQLTRWLDTAGYPSPRVDQVHIDIQYTTRVYSRTAVPDAKPVVYFVIDIDRMCGGAAFPIEGNRWIVTLAGYHGLRAEPDEKSLLAFAEALPVDDLAAVIRSEEPLSPILTHRFPSSQWRRYEKLSRHLSGAIAIGDSICSFNPLYGQGMSSAALQAEALARSLQQTQDDPEKLPRVFYRAAAKVIANPWAIAVGGDFVSPQTTGPKPPLTDLMNRYVSRLVVAAQSDPVVTGQFAKVTNLMAPPPSLLKPGIALRVWRGSRKARATTLDSTAPVDTTVSS